MWRFFLEEVRDKYLKEKTSWFCHIFRTCIGGCLTLWRAVVVAGRFGCRMWREGTFNCEINAIVFGKDGNVAEKHSIGCPSCAFDAMKCFCAEQVVIYWEWANNSCIFACITGSKGRRWERGKVQGRMRRSERPGVTVLVQWEEIIQQRGQQSVQEENMMVLY